jgi:hypothetical protein
LSSGLRVAVSVAVSEYLAPHNGDDCMRLSQSESSERLYHLNNTSDQVNWGGRSNAISDLIRIGQFDHVGPFPVFLLSM